MNKPPPTEEELRELYLAQGKTMHETANTLGVAVGTVYNCIHSYGIPAREKHKGMLGKKASPETRQKQSAALKGKKHSPEWVKKSADAQRLKGEGHKKRRDDGYIKVYYPTHPRSTKDGYVMEHILVMEKMIGRHLEEDEVVHHKNHIRDDNRECNLQLMTFKEHASLHMKERHQKRRGDLSTNI